MECKYLTEIQLVWAYSVLPNWMFNSIFPSHDTIATIIENCFENEKKTLLIEQLIILKCWTVYAWLSGNESESKRMYCFNLKIRICNWNERIKKELICSLKSLNFNIRKNWMSWYKNSLSHLRAHTIRANNSTEWMNEWTHVRKGLWIGMAVYACYTLFSFSSLVFFFTRLFTLSFSFFHTHA